MLTWGGLFVEFVILLITSRIVSASLYSLLYMFLKSRKGAITILAIFFFPGVVIHELAHFLVAGALFVPTGEIEFFPEVRGESVKLGSVQVGRTDIIRRFLIGVSPVIVGSMIVSMLAWYIGRGFSFSLFVSSFSEFGKYIGIIYIIFVIANTMFSSKKDLEGTMEFLILCLILFLTLFISNKALILSAFHTVMLSGVVQSVGTIDELLVLPVLINGLCVGIFKMLLKR